MADDFRCQVKQIIADFKAAERIIGDISVGIVGVAHPLWTGIPKIQHGLRRVCIVLVPVQMEQVAVEVIAYVPLRPTAVRYGGCSGADRHRAATQPVQTVVAEELADEAAAGCLDYLRYLWLHLMCLSPNCASVVAC